MTNQNTWNHMHKYHFYINSYLILVPLGVINYTIMIKNNQIYILKEIFIMGHGKHMVNHWWEVYLCSVIQKQYKQYNFEVFLDERILKLN